MTLSTTAEAQRTARNASALIIASIISKGALFLWQLILAPALGESDYGIYGTVGALMAIGGLTASFSMGLIVIRDIARSPEKTGQYWTALIGMQTVLALLTYIGMNLIARVSYNDPLISQFVMLAGINLFVDMAGNMCFDLLLAHEQMVKTAIIDVVHIALRIGLAAFALALGYGLIGVYVAAIISGILRAIMFWGLMLNLGYRPSRKFNRVLSRLLLLNSLPLALSGVLSLVYQHIDKLMTTGLLDETQTGFLTLAFVFNFGVIEIFSTTVLVAVYPMMSRYSEDQDNDAFGFMVEKLSLFMFMLALPITLILSIYADHLIAPFGANYAPASGILTILIWYTLITMFGNVYAKAMLVQNRQRLLVLLRAAGLVLNITLNFILLTRYQDPRGAAIASVFSELLYIVLLLFSFRATGWNWQHLMPKLIRLGLIAILMILVLLWLEQIHFVIGILVSIIVYLFGVLLMRILQGDDWDLLYRLIDAMPFGNLVQRFWKRKLA